MDVLVCSLIQCNALHSDLHVQRTNRWCTGLFSRLDPSVHKISIVQIFHFFDGSSLFRSMRLSYLFHQVIVPFAVHLHLPYSIEHQGLDQFMVQEGIHPGLAELIERGYR